MKIQAWLALAAAALTLSGCSTFSITTDHAPGYDFARLRSWQWAPRAAGSVGDDPRLRSGLLHERIRAAVTDGLRAKGLVQRESGADALVTYHVAIDRKLDVRTMHTSMPAGRGVIVGVPEVDVREYEVGTLVLDLIDARAGRLVWRGAAQARMNERSDPAAREARARAAVNEMLERYPPR